MVSHGRKEVSSRLAKYFNHAENHSVVLIGLDEYQIKNDL